MALSMRLLSTYARSCRQLAVVRTRQLSIHSSLSEEEKVPKPGAEAPLPKPGSASKKVKTLVEDIAKLTLLEVAELNELLKAKLNIKDVAMAPAPSAAAAPGPAVAAPQEPAAAAQSSFTVKLVKIDPKTKVKAIKAVKDMMPALNLVEAKKFVEELPQVLKKDISKEDAEKLKALMAEAGAEVAFE